MDQVFLNEKSQGASFSIDSLKILSVTQDVGGGDRRRPTGDTRTNLSKREESDKGLDQGCHFQLPIDIFDVSMVFVMVDIYFKVFMLIS